MFASLSLKLFATLIRWFSAAEEGTGLIASQEDFDAYPWPDAEDFNYSALDNISRYLPQGARVIVNAGYIFTASWMLMGLETFCTTLADNPELIQKVVDKVGTIQHQVMEIVLDYDCVGAARMPDDMAYGRGQSYRPRICGDIYSPCIGKSVNLSVVKICLIFCIPMVGCTKFWMT